MPARNAVCSVHGDEGKAVLLCVGFGKAASRAVNGQAGGPGKGVLGDGDAALRDIDFGKVRAAGKGAAADAGHMVSQADRLNRYPAEGLRFNDGQGGWEDEIGGGVQPG